MAFSNKKIEKELAVKADYHVKNIVRDSFMTSTDRVHWVMQEHSQKLEAKNSWKAPLGIILTIALTLLTTDFNKTWIGILPHVWEAIAYVILSLAILDLFRCVPNLFYKKSVEDIVNSLKAEEALEKQQNISVILGNNIMQGYIGGYPIEESIKPTQKS